MDENERMNNEYLQHYRNTAYARVVHLLG